MTWMKLAAAADEELHADLIFGMSKQLADRGLRNTEQSGGGRHAAGTHHGPEDLHLPDVQHASPPRHFQFRGTSSPRRSEEHTSELQSLLRTSSAVFCLKKKNQHTYI